MEQSPYHTEGIEEREGPLYPFRLPGNPISFTPHGDRERRRWVDGEIFGTMSCANWEWFQWGAQGCGQTATCVYCAAGRWHDLWQEGAHIARDRMEQLKQEYHLLFRLEAPLTFEQAFIALYMVLSQDHCTKLRKDLARFGHLTKTGRQLKTACESSMLNFKFVEIRRWNMSSGGYQVRAYHDEEGMFCVNWFTEHIKPFFSRDVTVEDEVVVEVVKAGLSLAWFQEKTGNRTIWDVIPNFYFILASEVEEMRPQSVHHHGRAMWNQFSPTGSRSSPY